MRVQCAVAGGGPAGMMLGFLLARAGVSIVVLEKHADFLRDFRGDTIHPSTLELMHELGILDELLKRPHQEVRELTGHVAGQSVTIGDFRHLPTVCKFVAMMPQWEFLNFIAEQARRLPAFNLMMPAEATGLIEENGRVAGLTVNTPDGPLEIRADLVVGADGRHSLVRERAGLAVDDFGAPMDVLWMRVSRKPADPEQVFGYIEAGHIFVMLDRGDYWQCAYVIPKGAADEVRARGLPAFRKSIAGIVPFLGDRVEELRDWDDIKLLTVTVDRLRRWYRPGLLCIGDAAHAMSPIGGVGINLAVQDAVAAANILAAPLARGACSDEDLARVQKRRELPMRLTQWVQLTVQNRFLGKVLGGQAPKTLPLALKLLQRWPMLRRIPAYLVGVGVRPEHIRPGTDVARHP
jgi:2-polyprenyl-6-methoxyphenol hydroxylase-like FAD-dependent oxidoreductase